MKKRVQVHVAVLGFYNYVRIQCRDIADGGGWGVHLSWQSARGGKMSSRMNLLKKKKDFLRAVNIQLLAEIKRNSVNN